METKEWRTVFEAVGSHATSEIVYKVRYLEGPWASGHRNIPKQAFTTAVARDERSLRVLFIHVMQSYIHVMQSYQDRRPPHLGLLDYPVVVRLFPPSAQDDAYRKGNVVVGNGSRWGLGLKSAEANERALLEAFAAHRLEKGAECGPLSWKNEAC
jgi:hypothetical protein